MAVLWKHACGWTGHARELEPGQVQEKGKQKDTLGCPVCGPRARVKIESPRFIQAATSCPKTASNGHYPWLLYRDSKNIAADECGAFWIFADGASSGSYAAVIVGGAHSEHVRHGPPHAIRNVHGELMAVALGLSRIPKGEHVVLVCDFLGTACWFMGKWAVGDPATIQRLRLIGQIMEDRDLTVQFIHVRGHGKDDSEFTRWNNRADQLCAERPKPPKVENEPT